MDHDDVQVCTKKVGGGVRSDAHSHQHSAQDLNRPSSRPLRVEVITGDERRRRWSAQERARITSESFEPGVNISAVARRNGVSAGLLHYWRRRVRDFGQAEELRFIPVKSAEATLDVGPAAVTAGCIEIDVTGLRIRVIGVVDAAALRAVLAVVRTST